MNDLPSNTVFGTRTISPAGYSHRSRRGQVLALTLIALAALVGLVMFVYNVGHQVNRRSDLQKTADSTATAGASWMSRSMNVVAMNNLAQARMLSLVPVLDAIPLSAEITLQEMILDMETGDSLPMGLTRQLQRGVPNTRQEQAYVEQSRLDATVADAVLFMPADEPELEPIWPLPSDVRARIASVGRVVGNDDAGFETSGDWRTTSGVVNAHRGSSAETLQQGASARWTTTLPAPGSYDVYAWWSSTTDGTNRDSSARYSVGGSRVTRNQNRNCGTWNRLGTFSFSENQQGEVVASVTVERTSRGGDVGGPRVNFVRTGLEKLEAQMTPGDDGEFQSQFDALSQLDEALDSPEKLESGDGHDIRSTTHWNPGTGLADRGELWEAMITLDEVSQATVDSAGLLAQADAVRFGEANDVDTSAVVPVRPKIPARRGEFEDFLPVLGGHLTVTSDSAEMSMPIYPAVNTINQLSVRLQELEDEMQELQRKLDELLRLPPEEADEEETEREIEEIEQRMNRLLDRILRLERRKESLLGGLHNRGRGGAIPDWEYPHRLGPFARLLRWRHNIRERVNGGGTPPSDPGWGGDPEVGAPRMPGGGGSWRTIGYRTYGPYWWAMDRMYHSFGLVGRRTGPADVSRFVSNHRLISNIKFGYLFGLDEPQTVKYARRWITDFEEAREYASDPERRRRIIRTRYYRPLVMSSVSWDSDDWLKDPSTYWSPRNHISPPDDPRASLWVSESRGWRDVEQFRPEAERVNDYIWRWSRSYDEVAFDQRVNLYPRYDSNTGEPIPWELYICSWFIFGGIEVYEETVEVSNPFNFSSGDSLPAPMLLDTSDGDYDPTIPPGRVTPDEENSFRRQYFTLLGVARQNDDGVVWPQQFYSADPTESMLAISQARMFNNRSFDLWTQDWQNQLAPVTGWTSWIQRLRDGIPDAGDMGELLSEEELEDIERYMSALEGRMLELFMTH